MKHRLFLYIVIGLLLSPRPAGADLGLWLWTEYRQPIVGGADSKPPRFWLRLSSDTRFFIKTQGLDEGFLRVAFVVEPTSWFYVALSGAFAVDRDVSTLAYQQETRLELEPHFFSRIGPITFDDRNRIEYRHRQPVETATKTLNGFDRFRYRNLLRINYEPVSWRWVPFVLNEWLFNLGFDQNRLGGGIGRKLTSNIRLDAAYLWRTARPFGSAEWTVSDHMLLLFLYIGLTNKPVSG